MSATAARLYTDESTTRPRRIPLYLSTTQVTTVTLDGPALRITANGRPVSRYPLDRIERVVSRGPVQWRAEALCALMQSGIPVVMVGASGEPVGYCWPVGHSPVPLAARLEELLDQDGWQTRYQNWHKAQRMRVLSEWRHMQEQAGTPVADWQYAALVRSHVYGMDWKVTGEQDKLRRGAIVALVAGQVARAGLSPQYQGWGESQLDLVSSLADLLELRFDLELGALGATMQADEAARLWVLSPAYGRLTEHCAALLGSLARWIREAAAPWR